MSSQDISEHDKLVEDCARAICRAYFYCDLDTPDGRVHWQREQDKCRLQARAALAIAVERCAAITSDPWAHAPREYATGEELCEGVAAAIRALLSNDQETP